MVVSNVAPAESATNKANRRGCSSNHLTNVVDFVDRRTAVEIGALTVDNDVSTTLRRAMPINLDATLTIGAYSVFEELFQ